MRKKMVFQTDSSIEAHLVVHQLQQAGIDARIQGEYLQGGVGVLAPFGNVRVLVASEHADEARKVISDWEASDPPD